MSIKKRPFRIEINNIMLKKIREHLEFSLEEASVKIRRTSKLSSIEVLKSWEDGIKIPTVKQLTKLFDHTYRYPVFIVLGEPGEEGVVDIPPEEDYGIHISRYPPFGVELDEEYEDFCKSIIEQRSFT